MALTKKYVDKRTPEQHKDRALRYKYKINLKEYNLLCEIQNGKCAICKRTEIYHTNKHEKSKFLCVDHDHNTGRVRGLLCQRCNICLGLVEDNASFLQNMVNYLNK